MRYSTDDYPLSVLSCNEDRAFELYDNLVEAFESAGLEEDDAMTLADVQFPALAKELKGRNWDK